MSGLAGVVLAGGWGRRHGGPKAWARSDDGTPWLQEAVGALRPQCEAGVVVATRRGIGAPRGGADAVVFDGLVDAGPLAGLRAGLGWCLDAGAARALVLPVDVLVDADLRALLGRLAAHPAERSVGAVDPTGHRHHLLARFEAAPAAQVAAERLARGKRAVRPLHERLGTLWLSPAPVVDRNEAAR